MIKIKHLYLKNYELFSYIIFGGMTTIVNLFLFFTLNSLLGINYLIANIISIVFSILFAYVVNKKYVFRMKNNSIKKTIKEIFLFFIFRSASLIIDMGTMWLLVETLLFNANIAKLFTEVLIVIINFIVSKFIVFKNT